MNEGNANGFDKSEYYKDVAEKSFSIYTSVAQFFDKAMLSLTTISLGFTFALARVLKEEIECKLLFGLTWVSLIIILFSILLTNILMQKNAMHKYEYFQGKYIGSNDNLKEKHWTDRWIEKLGVFSAIMFIVAMIFFARFVYLNM